MTLLYYIIKHIPVLEPSLDTEPAPVMAASAELDGRAFLNDLWSFLSFSLNLFRFLEVESSDIYMCACDMGITSIYIKALKCKTLGDLISYIAANFAYQYLVPIAL